MCVQLSWNGGTSWTSSKTTSTLSTSEVTYVLGSATNPWGRMWSATNLGNAGFRVRVVNVASSTSRDFLARLDRRQGPLHALTGPAMLG
jgi:hypothetical protein